MWFRKRDDVMARYLAIQCGIEKEFGMVGSVIHKDDLEKLRVDLFRVSASTMDQLFKETKI